MKKFITLLLCVTMVVSMLVVPASAELGNYNDQSGFYALTNYAGIDINDYIETQGYVSGIAGKADTDYSYAVEFKTLDTTSITPLTPGGAYSGFYQIYNNNSSPYTNTTFDYDVYVSGDVALRLQTSSTGTGLYHDIFADDCDGRWIHVTAWAGTNTFKVYIDGKEVHSSSQSNFKRHRLVLMLAKAGAATTGTIAIDNVTMTSNVTTAPVYNDLKATSASNDIKLCGNLVNVTDGTTVDTLKSNVSFDDANVLYDVYAVTNTSTYTKKNDSDIVNIGDVIVAYDSAYVNTNMKYIDVVDSDTINEAINSANLITYVDFENSETLNTANNTGATATHLPGLYGKSADDTAYVLQAGTAVSPRVNLKGYEPFTTPANWNTADFAPATATLEFSFAIAPGMYDDFQIYGMPKYKVKDSVDDNTRYELTTQFFQVTDGVELTANTMGYKFDYPAGQWVRIAITIDGANETYDMYVNGVLARNDAPVGMATSTTKWTGAGTLVTDWTGDNTDNWEFVGLSEIRVQGYRTSGQVSDIAIDDIKAYYGDYGSTDCVTVNGYDNFDPDGTIVLDEGDSLTVAELTAAVGDADVAVYTDSTYTTAFTGDTLDANAVAVVTDGFVKRYFKADNIRMNADDSIKLYDADGELAAITAGASIYAKATPDYVGHKPTLIMAIYNGDELETVKIAVGNSGKSIQTEAYTVADDADVSKLSVKAMLWDGFENIKPYAEAIAIPAN